MLAFAHLAERRPDAPADHPDPIHKVEALAEQVLGDQASAYASPTSDARGAISRASDLTLVPEMDGVEFNPPRRVFRWLEDIHKEEFRLRAGSRLDGQVAYGRLTVFRGLLILADVNLMIKIHRGAAPPPGTTIRDLEDASVASTLEPAHGSPYRNVFLSYSHRDTEIVEQVERLASLGDVYLRDRTTLRSGQEWSEELLKLIDNAHMFQLFWSSNSMRSEYVRQEWEHAVALDRPNFIRPIYWEQPMPRSDNPLLPPSSLRRLHFHLLVLSPRAGSRGTSPAGGRRIRPSPRIGPREAEEHARREAEEQAQREAEEHAQRKAAEYARQPPGGEMGLAVARGTGPAASLGPAAGRKKRAAVVRRAAVLVGVLVLVSILILLLWSK